jgi:endonuclease/exonuclease/phosphatase family metal-dependent hydrolase
MLNRQLPDREQRLRTRVLSALRQHASGPVSSMARPEAGVLVASYNVHKCVGTDKRYDPDRTASVIAEIGADIIALQEADKRFGERAGLLDVHRLERECGLVPAPTPGRLHGQGWHGNLLLFREGIVRDVHQIRLPGIEPRGALMVDVDLSGGPMRIVAAHLGLLRRSRAQQAQAIISAISMHSDRPTLLLGDFNEWRVGAGSSLLNLDPAFGPVHSSPPSFPSRVPVFALDRIMSKPHDLIAAMEVHRTPLARQASDHLPIKAMINLAAAGLEPADRDAMMAA